MDSWLAILLWPRFRIFVPLGREPSAGGRGGRTGSSQCKGNVASVIRTTFSWALEGGRICLTD